MINDSKVFQQKNLKYIRILCGLTQESLAAELDCAIQTIRNWELGIVSMSHIQKLGFLYWLWEYVENDDNKSYGLTGSLIYDLVYEDDTCGDKNDAILIRGKIDAMREKCGTKCHPTIIRQKSIKAYQRSKDYENYRLGA